jgi:hypothetical protein
MAHRVGSDPFRDLTKTMVPMMAATTRPPSNHGHHVVPLDPSVSPTLVETVPGSVDVVCSGSDVAIGASVVVAAVVGGRVVGGRVVGGRVVGEGVGGGRVVGGTVRGGSVGGGTVGGGSVVGGTVVGGTVVGRAVVGGSVRGGSVVGASVRGGSVSGGSVSEGRVTSGRVSGGSVSAPLDGGPVPRPGGAVMPGGRVTDGVPPPEHDIVRIAAAVDRTTNRTTRIA